MEIASAILQLPTIGTPFAGGFYAGRFRIGDRHFALIASPAAGDVEGAWGPRIDVPGATSFCDGLANTEAMAAAGNPVAQAIKALTINGLADWYLPSRDELELLYRHLKPSEETNAVYRYGDNPSSEPPGYPYTHESPAQTSVAAFQSGGAEALQERWYWSSTQYSRDSAWGQYFVGGYQGYDGKGYEGRARAVRRLVIE